jgi:hypothetical protein
VSKNSQKAKFAIESLAWQEMNPKICYLEEQYRQEDDKMIKVLNAIRSGMVDAQIMLSILSRENQPVESDIYPTKLFTHNANVDAINDFELQKIKEKPLAYNMQSSGLEPIIKMLKKGCSGWVFPLPLFPYLLVHHKRLLFRIPPGTTFPPERTEAPDHLQ